MGQKNFPGAVALGPPRGLSMSTPVWVCWPKPSLHELSLSKSPIKNHAILYGSDRVVEPDQTKLGSTKPNRTNHAYTCQ